MKAFRKFMAGIAFALLGVAGCDSDNGGLEAFGGEGLQALLESGAVSDESTDGVLGSSTEQVDVYVTGRNDLTAYRVNDVIEYVIETGNDGPGDVAGTRTLVFNLPAGTSLVEPIGGVGFTCEADGLVTTCVNPFGASRGSAWLFYPKLNAPATTGDITLQVSITYDSNESDSDTTNETLSITNKIGLPMSDLQTLVDAALPGDTINVAPGVYVGCLDYGGKDVNLVSTGGPEQTTFAAFECGHIVDIGPDGTLEGFTLIDFMAFSGNSDYDAAIDVSGTGSVIRGNIFEDNNTRITAREPNGTAISGNSTSPLVEGNIFRNIVCEDTPETPVVDFFNGSEPVIRNNIWYNNRCVALDMSLPAGNSPLIINNTIVGNNVGIFYNRNVSQVTQTYRNNIIVGNGIGIDADGGTDADNPVYENNLVFGNNTDFGIATQTGSNGNISADPMFTNSRAFDYTLMAGSPAIDAGSATGAPATDFAGNARPVDGDGSMTAEFDIGAYESP